LALSNSTNIYDEKNRIFKEFLNLSRSQLNSINQSEHFKDFLILNKKEDVEDLFLTIARTSPNIMQLRYIDKIGDEILRVQRDRLSKKVSFVENNELQNKKNRYYFSHSLNMENQEVWFSNLDLNIENEKVQKPFTPTIRAILPIRENNAFNGILIINYYMENFLDTLKDNTIYNTILFDKDGNTLTHYEKEKSWGFYLDKKYNLNDEYKNEISNALKNNQYENSEVFIKKFDFDVSNELYLLVKLKDKYITQLKTDQFKEYIVVSFIVFLLGIISSLFISRIFNSLSKIISKTDDRLIETSVLVKLSYFKYNYEDRLITFDDNFFNLLNYKDIEKKSFNFDELKKFFNKDFLDKLKIKISDIKDKDSFEFEIQTKENKTLIFFTKFRAIYENNKIAEIEGIFQDITEQKNLMQSFEEASIEAKNANEAKSKFLATMSHKIRTPLNGIIGLNKLALDSNPNTKIREFLVKSEISSKALLNVINDILDYSKIEANMLSLEKTTFELDKLFLNVTDLFDYQAYKKEIDLHIDFDNNIPRILIGDPHRITQILNNLVGNAIKFTDTGSIEVNATLIEKNDNNLVLKCSVKDTGIGMGANEQEKLFKSFSQIDDSTTRVYGGSGLGLTITKELIELMNGKIEVSSKKGLGTIFSFTIDLEYEDAFEFNNTLFKSKNFLVIDDNEIDIRIIENILKSWEIKTYSCLNAKDALSKIEEGAHFDYILVDWIMPEIDGVDFIKELQEKNLKTCPKIIMVTAYEEDNLKKKLKDEDVLVNNILRKPFTPSSIYDTLIEFEESNKENYKNSNNDYEKEKNINSINANILVVEDNKINQTVCQEILKRVGVKVTLANNGIEAVNICKSNKFDMILMDLHMPKMNGFDASLSIRQFDDKTPIIALTAAVMAEDKILSKKVGMQDHLAKPIEFDELFKCINKYIPNLVVLNESKKQVSSSNIHLDFEELLNRVGSSELANELLNEFINEYKNCINEFKSSLNNESFNNDIHKLKGVSGNLSLKVLYEICIKIEKETENEKRSKLLDDLSVELDEVIRVIQS
tara:strand:- start:3159 stop:6302 length:3144 start_codon:yes stop_codon:yes gene_type:complete